MIHTLATGATCVPGRRHKGPTHADGTTRATRLTKTLCCCSVVFQECLVMAFEVKKAKRRRRPLKISLEGLAGSGKTYTALRLAFEMLRRGIGNRIVVADSENESAGLYAGITADGQKWDYETCAIPQEMQNPAGYADCYEFLVEQGFDIIIFDSLSHAWHGAQEIVDNYGARNRGDKFGGWALVTPQQRRMLSTLTDPRAHLIATMRVKSEYERVAGANGKDKIKKVSMKADQRDGAEYEFDCVVRLECGDHAAHVEKVRGCEAMDDRAGVKPDPKFWKPLLDWWLMADATPTPPPVDEIAEGRAKLDAAATLPEMAAAWGKLPAHVQQVLLSHKDQRKAALSRPVEPQRDVADSPSEPSAKDDSELVNRIEHAMRDSKTRGEFDMASGLMTVHGAKGDISPKGMLYLRDVYAEEAKRFPGKPKNGKPVAETVPPSTEEQAEQTF